MATGFGYADIFAATAPLLEPTAAVPSAAIGHTGAVTATPTRRRSRRFDEVGERILREIADFRGESPSSIRVPQTDEKEAAMFQDIWD